MPFTKMPPGAVPPPACPSCKGTATVFSIVRYGLEYWCFCPLCEHAWVIMEKELLRRSPTEPAE